MFCKKWLEGDLYFEFETSGTTSGQTQKRIVKREQIIASVEGTAQFFKLKKGDSAFMCLNPAFTGGIMMLARAVHLGLKLFIVPSTANPLYDLPDNEKITITSFVPYQLFEILNMPEGNRRLAQFGAVLIGGARTTFELIEKLRLTQHTSIYETFGMTETLSHFALRNLMDPKASSFSVLPTISIRTDEFGCLSVMGAVTENKWLKTNDVVTMLSPKHFVWRGRADNVVNSGGIKIQPEEIEELIAPILTQFGYHGNYFVMGNQDAKLGEKLVLVVEQPLNQPSKLIERMKETLPKHYSPKEIHIVDFIRKTTSGKIIRSV